MYVAHRTCGLPTPGHAESRRLSILLTDRMFHGRFASLMADARNAYGGLTGTDDETVEPETPSILWSSLEQRESDLGSAWANDKHHNALCAPDPRPIREID